ncbi:MAG: serine protease [Bdellovibrionaceae bacterium]|nr:serine protease [Pseudobdellovibrionaceae bacterium]
MLTRMILSLSAVLVWSATASAATKRYIVTFKNPGTFHEVASSFKGGLNLFSQNEAMAVSRAVQNVEVLDRVEMLVVEADSQGLAQLENLSEIANIEEEQFFPAPSPIGTFSHVPTSLKAFPTNVERPWGIDAVKAPGAWQITKGEGMTVVVIDTGIDEDHPAIASRFLEGRNFLDTNNPNDYSDTVGHGTHVAGTILADGLNHGLVGVAPEAKLKSAKVCGNLGCSTVAIASAVNWAMEQQAQVVNMSLGGPFMTFAEKKAYDAAEAAGTMIVAASGNNGNNKVSFPAAYTTTFAVGAVNPDLTKAQFSQWGPELDVVAPGVDVVSSVPVGSGRTSQVMVDFGKGSEVLKSTSFQGSAVSTVEDMPMAYVGLGKPEDFQGVDLRGKTALILRGEIRFSDKVQNAIRAGAEAVMIFNNEPGLIQGALTDDGSELAIPVVMVEQVPGQRMKDLLAKGSEVTTSMGVVPADYAAFQGTSMASPHVAGVATLVRAANPSLTPAQVRALIKETATPLTPNNENQMGSGMVNAELAVQKARESMQLDRVVGF